MGPACLPTPVEGDAHMLLERVRMFEVHEKFREYGFRLKL